MYLLGDNSIRNPWYLPSDFPNRALNPEDKDKLFNLIKSRQNSFEWNGAQKDFYFASRIFCPPIADLVHKCFRKRHFNRLQDETYRAFNTDFWDLNGNQSKTLRVSSSTQDY